MAFLSFMMGMLLQAHFSKFVTDPDLDFEVRQEFYQLFGTFSRSVFVVFELTIGNWVPACRFVLEHGGELWAFLLLLFRIVVSFSVMQVISAVTMHETFKAAGMDDELMIMTHMSSQKKFGLKMHLFLNEADRDGNDTLDLKELEEALNDPRMRTWLQAMDLNIHEPRDAFAYVVRGQSMKGVGPVDNQLATYEDLTRGFARLRGAAKACDLLAVMEELKTLRHEEIPAVRHGLLETSEAISEVHRCVERLLLPTRSTSSCQPPVQGPPLCDTQAALEPDLREQPGTDSTQDSHSLLGAIRLPGKAPHDDVPDALRMEGADADFKEMPDGTPTPLTEHML